MRRAFILGALLRLSPAFLLSAPEGSSKESFDDRVTATRAYCMGDELDNRAAESAWREQMRGTMGTERVFTSAENGGPAANDRECKAAA